MHPYRKLEPEPPGDICTCRSNSGLILVSLMTSNPLHCIQCKGEIPPQWLELKASLVEAIASWRDTHDSLYWLWLESGAYEQWAKSELLNAKGAMNQDGLQIRCDLHSILQCEYWWFTDSDDPEPTNCPVCTSALSESETAWGTYHCPACHITA